MIKAIILDADAKNHVLTANPVSLNKHKELIASIKALGLSSIVKQEYLHERAGADSQAAAFTWLS